MIYELMRVMTVTAICERLTISRSHFYKFLKKETNTKFNYKINLKIIELHEEIFKKRN
jgi:predicted DNA-binding transcriptional regulator AlpA